MSEEAERIYTINLGKVLLSPNNIRAKRAINMIKEFTMHHMKTNSVRISEDVAHYVWKRGIKHPPRKIRVGMERTDEGFVLVYLYDKDEAAADATPAAVEPTEPRAPRAAAIPAGRGGRTAGARSRTVRSRTARARSRTAQNPK